MLFRSAEVPPASSMIVSCASIHVACVLGKWSTGGMAGKGTGARVACVRRSGTKFRRGVGALPPGRHHARAHDARKGIEWKRMRPTLTVMEVHLQLDTRELQAAAALTGIADPAKLIPHVLREFVHARAFEEALKLSACDPNANAAPRRKPPDFPNPGSGQAPTGA